MTVSASVTNTGERSRRRHPAGLPDVRTTRRALRLLGFSRVDLNPHETKQVTIKVDPRLLADWDVSAHGWRIQAGDYKIAVGQSSQDLASAQSVALRSRRLAP